jgi:hypothetical protein
MTCGIGGLEENGQKQPRNAKATATSKAKRNSKSRSLRDDKQKGTQKQRQ